MFKVAFGEQALGITQVFELFFKFKGSVTSLTDAEHSRHVSAGKTDENVHLPKEDVIKNRRVTVYELANVGQFRTF